MFIYIITNQRIKINNLKVEIVLIQINETNQDIEIIKALFIKIQAEEQEILVNDLLMFLNEIIMYHIKILNEIHLLTIDPNYIRERNQY